jgi:hypothetical protein
MPRLSKIGAAALAAFGWTGLSTVTASYLVVAGGGGGAGSVGSYGGGGGGAGGYQTGTASLNPTQSYTITVGAGGAGSLPGTAAIGTNGANSQIGSLTASVGGGGGASSNNNNGNNGGSGGAGAPVTGTGGTATSGQGNRGGNAAATRGGAGGGGFGSAGSDQTANSYAIPSNGVSGGTGTTSAISGATVTYAGGGGGGAMGSGGSGGAGGSSVGGAGANGASGLAGGTGVVNTGSGGGGGSSDSGGSTTTAGGQGGSGVVIISYTAPQKFGGGVVTTSGSNVIHTFNTSGTLTPLSSLTASYLIVAGGGSGGATSNSPYYWSGGGGGAGGLLSGSGLTIDPNSTYLVTVGAGGAAPANNSVGSQGGNSSFSMVTTTALGGGYGGYGAYPGTGGNGSNGGSGGGAGQSYGGATTSGTGTAGQGYAGGTPVGGPPNYYCSGGGGAGGAGTGITGGIGVASSISGTSTTYATGGTGQVSSPVNGTSGSGNGGAGNGNGGATANNAGGSGVVIISYAGSTQQMAGGTVTISGGNVIHTFTSSGYLTPIKYVNNSLRFRASASAYLNRTPATSGTGGAKTWSYSTWFKRGSLGSNQALFWADVSSSPSDTNNMGFAFQSGDTLSVQGQTINFLVTSQVFRDPASWYHAVLTCDTTQATASNRLKLYINGLQVTSFSTANYPSQNATVGIGLPNPTFIGAQSSTPAQYFDGYQTEINFIDGQALTPNSFGTINSYGVWQPITYGGSYGTNGFYLPFTGGSSYYGTFNGSNQYLQATLPATLTGAFTIETFAYRASSGTVTYFCLGDSQTASGLEVYIGTSGTVFQVYGNNGAQITTTTTVPNNAWSHIALTRDSSNVIRLFLNGVQVGGTWTYSTAISSTLRIGVEYYGGALSGAGYWNGNMSNFRIINGTALYTSSSFTPPTSALTAVSGTSILTLQSSTIIDNSGNSVSITNNNTVTTAQAYPFTMIGNQSKDYSPNGNNWTNNNIGVVAGSTLDVMTDVPTLTSATAANYAVLNSLDKSSNSTITNGNLYATSSSAAWSGVRGSIQLPTTGQWYWEVNLVSMDTVNNGTLMGVAPATANLTTGPGVANGCWLYENNGGSGGIGRLINSAGTITSYGAQGNTGDVIGIAYDAGAGSLLFYRNGTSMGTAFSSGVSGALFPIIQPYYNDIVSVNFGQRPFAYTPPTGYVALNTYNL